jgi:hypothetical protein
MRSRKDNLKLCQERNRKEREGTGRIRIGRDNENAAYQDIISWGFKRTKAGYTKIKYCCAQAIENGLEWAWIDT